MLQIAAMGFDEARVARTYKRLKKDQVKVRRRCTSRSAIGKIGAGARDYRSARCSRV